MTEEEDEQAFTLPVIDPHNVPITYVDWFLPSGAAADGIVNLSLGAIDPTGGAGGPPPVVVVTKLRMSLDFATRMQRLLEAMIADHQNALASQKGRPSDE